MAKKKTDAPQPDASAPEEVSKLDLELDDAPADVPDDASEPVVDDAAGVDEPSLLPTAVSLAKQRGYEVDDDATDDDFWNRVEDLESKAEKLEATDRELQELRARLAQIESERKPAEEQQPEPKTAEAADDDYGIPDRPKLDRYTLQILQLAKSNGLLKEGAGGLISSDDGSLRPHIDKYNQHLIDTEAYDEQWGDPRKVAAHIVRQSLAKEREAIRKQLQEEVTGTLTQRDSQSFIDTFNKQNADWLGTEVGKQVAAEANALMERGFTPEESVKRAKAYVQAETGQSPWNRSADTAAEPPQSRVVKFRNRLKNNVHATTPRPASRPSAGVGTRNMDGLSINQKLDATFDALMNEQVAERM